MTQLSSLNKARRSILCRETASRYCLFPHSLVGLPRGSDTVCKAAGVARVPSSDKCGGVGAGSGMRSPWEVLCRGLWLSPRVTTVHGQREFSRHQGPFFQSALRMTTRRPLTRRTTWGPAGWPFPLKVWAHSPASCFGPGCNFAFDGLEPWRNYSVPPSHPFITLYF